MSIRKKDPLMMDALKGTCIIEADVDDWGFPPRGWRFTAIPVFYALGSDGKPTGDWIDGNAWGENIPGNFAPALKEFFQSLKK